MEMVASQVQQARVWCKSTWDLGVAFVFARRVIVQSLKNAFSAKTLYIQIVRNILHQLQQVLTYLTIAVSWAFDFIRRWRRG